jgi:outer membrane autotransporter protein
LRNDLSGQASIGTDATLDSYQIAGYGTWRPRGGPVFMNALLSFGINDYDQTRNIDFINTQATASYHGKQAQLKIGGGYGISLNNRFIFTPLVNLEATQVENNGYTDKEPV